MIKMHPIYHEYGADEQGNIYSFKSGEALPIHLSKCSSGYSNFSPSVKGKAKTLRAHGQLSKKYLARKFKVDPTTILRVWRKST